MQSLALRLVLILLTGWLTSAAWVHPARADDATKAALIEEMFTLTKMEALLQQMMDQVKTAQKTQFEKLDMPAATQADMDDLQNRVMAVVNERLGWQKLKPLYAKLYSDTFSEAELRATVEFYRSPAGKAMLEKMPTLMVKSMQVVQEQLGDLTPELKRIIEERAERHPEHEADKASEPPGH